MIKFWEANRDYFAHKQEIDEAIQRVLSKGELVLGFSPDITEFETKFAEFIGTQHAIMTGSGTHALYLSYRALGIGQGDEVIVPSMTFAATIDQIVALGAIPVTVDIGEDGLIDPIEVEKAITKRTKAIVPVHLEGKNCNMERINEIATNHGLIVIEDSAQAIGSKLDSNNTKCFSLFPAKILGSVGNAGMITTNDDQLSDKLRMLRCNYNLGKNPDTENAEWGMNMEPDNIQAAVLNVKFKYLRENLERRAEIARRYDEAFKDLPITLAVKQNGRVYQDYVLRIPENKAEFVKYLQDNGVGILGYNLIPHHHYKKLNLPFLPKTDLYIKQQIRIPINQNITDEEVEEVIRVIRSFYDKK